MPDPPSGITHWSWLKYLRNQMESLEWWLLLTSLSTSMFVAGTCCRDCSWKNEPTCSLCCSTRNDAIWLLLYDHMQTRARKTAWPCSFQQGVRSQWRPNIPQNCHGGKYLRLCIETVGISTEKLNRLTTIAYQRAEERENEENATDWWI